MTRNKHKESLPNQDYLDVEGDIRHADDNPEGFAASGNSPRGNFFRDDAEPTDDLYYDEIAEAQEIRGVSVDLGFRATNLLLATDSLAYASMLQGLLKAGNRRKIMEYGGERLIHTKIKAASRRGRQALRAASGLDAMLANPRMVPDEDGSPYTVEDAENDEVQIVYGFRQAYTADAYRNMPSGASVADKIAKKREVDTARHELRHNLARQLRDTKAQSQ